MGVPITAEGIDGLVAMPEFADIKIVFDATSAGAHHHHNAVLQAHGKRVVDLTPAAIGPYTIPPVNGLDHLDAPNVNMVTCGGQATIPMVHAVNRVAKVHYGEIVASISSKAQAPVRALISTSSPKRRPTPSKSWAGPNAARRSSCSTPPNRP